MKLKWRKNDTITFCISNGGQESKNETNMNKINCSAKMKVSTVNLATTHTHRR